MKKPRRATAAAALATAIAMSVALPVPVQADPPPWAPAHGYRNKHKQKHREAVAYTPPFGIDLGRCNREVVGAVIGGAAGGAIGSTIGKGDGQVAAVIGGTIVGILVGGAIGRSMDQADHSCTGQILEHAQDNQRIVWQAPSGAEYAMRPGRTWKSADGGYCRDYQATAAINGRQQQIYGKACRNSDGSWRLAT
jgi:surface antigen